MTAVQRLACFVRDSLGCALGALGAAPVRPARAEVEELGRNPRRMPVDELETRDLTGLLAHAGTRVLTKGAAR